MSKLPSKSKTISKNRSINSSKLTLTSPKQKKGERYELLACEYLEDQGLSFIARNWLQAKVGELDLVMIQKGRAWDTLVFIEVRVRKNANYGDALASVTVAKQRKIIKTAQFFLQQHPQYADYECRFDVVGFNGSVDNIDINDNLDKVDIGNTYQPEWIQGAFVGRGW